MNDMLNFDLMREVRAAILEWLYKLEKKSPGSQIVGRSLAEELNLTVDEIEFHLNYLDEKGFIKYNGSLSKGGGLARIAVLGIDAIESPESYVKETPFLQQLIIYGNVVDSNILQAESLRIRNGLNRIIESVTDETVKELIEELFQESKKEKPNIDRVKVVTDQIKDKAPEIAIKLVPYIQEILKKWLLG